MLDPHVALWILEFALRQPIEDWVAHELLLALPLPTSPLPRRLAATLLLRRLASLLSRRRVSSRILHSLELLHHLDPRGPHPPSLASAYAATALHLAAAPFRTARPDLFADAVEVVFRRRIGDLERSGAGAGLLGEELSEARRIVEAADACDEAAREELVVRDTRKEALESLRAYIKEAAAAMGPSFLELAAEAVNGEGVGAAIAELVEKHKAIVEARSNEASDGNQFDQLPTPEVCRVRETLKMSLVDLHMAVDDPLPNAVAVADNVLTSLTSLEEGKEYQDVEDANVPVSTVEKGPEVAIIEGTGTDVLQNREQEEAAPLSSLVIVNANDGNDLVRNDLVRNEADGNDNEPTCVPDEGAVMRNEGTSNGVAEHNKDVTRPSLMERNPTAHTYEWDDSIDSPSDTSTSSSSKLRLPRPKRRVVSPLTLIKNKTIVRRRKVKKWSVLEEDTLREAVNKHGKGNWKIILNSYPNIFEERTEVDLKDKWRNMTRG